MKHIKLTLVTLVVLLSLNGSSLAGYTGVLVGVYGDDVGEAQNDDATVVLDYVNEWLESQNEPILDKLCLYAKWETDRGGLSEGVAGTLTINYDSGDLSGSWIALTEVEFYVVKGSTQFAIYYVDGGAYEGTWSTEHLENNGGNQPALSHFSVYKECTPSVPAPAAIGLLMAGLGGFGAMRRRTKS